MTIHDKDPIFRFTIDKCGRFVLPSAVRNAMNVRLGDQIQMIPTDCGYLIQPVKNHCILCGSSKDLVKISLANSEEMICSECVQRIKNTNM